MRTTSRSVRSRARGYTAVEVMSAMTLFAIGAAGVVGMQRATVQGGADARHFDIAVNIGHEWSDRLQRDSMFWTKPNAAYPDVTDYTDTKFLNDINTPACNTGYCLAGGSADSTALLAAGKSCAFDILGREIPKHSDTTTEAYYCVQYQLQWIANPNNTGTCGSTQVCTTALMRADIRVLWAKEDLAPIVDCDNLATAYAAAPNNYHSVIISTALRENAPR